MAAPTGSSKPRVVKDYDKLDDAVLEQIKLEYPRGFTDKLVSFTNAQGKNVSALPFETEDRYYLVRMTRAEAEQIILEDEDYDDQGNLRPRVQAAYEDKYGDEDDDDDFDGGLDDELGDFDLDDDSYDGSDEDDGSSGATGGTVSLDGVDVVDPNSL